MLTRSEFFEQERNALGIDFKYFKESLDNDYYIFICDHVKKRKHNHYRSIFRLDKRTKASF